MQPLRTFDFIQFQLHNFPQEKAFGYRYQGNWIYYSTADIINLANKLSSGLISLGIEKGDRIALATYQNRPEWTIADLAIQQIGAINVPVYPTISSSEYEYIFKDAGVKMAFVGKDDLYEKMSGAGLNKIIVFDDLNDGKTYWKSLLNEDNLEQVEAIKNSILPDELATIIYTSGTTGHPKGVMLSHSNIVSNVLAITPISPISVGDSVLSFLPLCHIFERTASYHYAYKGTNVTFCSTEELGGEEGMLQLVKPHFFTTVPRLLEKVYEKIYNKGLELTGVKKKLFFWALDLTNDYEYDIQRPFPHSIKYKLADKLIFSKWRAALGGRVRGILTGAAPCPEKMLKIFSAAGVPIREGYGLTETSPGLCIGRYEKNSALIGTVGPPIDKIEIFIDDSEGVYLEGEGEILAYGPNIMMGYYNKPEATQEVMKSIGDKTWFKTGDIGRLVDYKGQKFLKITDRKKELLKTSGGKYVAPAPIENALKESFFVEQAMVVGDGKKFVSALIVPSKEALSKHLANTNINSEKSEITNLYQGIIDSVNQNLGHVEQIKKFTIVQGDWTPSKEDGTESELTPTMKLKRRVILEKYKFEIEELYA
jgi:long-chain acyl-CoA synthetase